MAIKCGDCIEDKFLNNLDEIATRAGFYTPAPGEEKPHKKPLKEKFDFRSINIPSNPMPYRLNEPEWIAVYARGYCGLTYDQIADVLQVHCQIVLDISNIAQYLKSAAQKLRLSDCGKKYIARWARKNPYNDLVEKCRPATIGFTIPSKPVPYQKLSDREWNAFYLCGYRQLGCYHAAEIIGGGMTSNNVLIDFHIGIRKLSGRHVEGESIYNSAIAFVRAHPLPVDARLPVPPALD